MKTTRYLFCLVTAMALMFSIAAQAKPKIIILATGGTIAGAQASKSEVGYKSGSFSVDDLIKAVPQLKDVADLSGEQVANIGSQTMNHEVWLKLADRVNEVLADKDVDGVVITHGTDTMEETAYFLASSCTATNRWCWSVRCVPPRPSAPTVRQTFTMPSRWRRIRKPAACGPLVVLNDEIHYAREAQKMNTHGTEHVPFAEPRPRRRHERGQRAFLLRKTTRGTTTKSEFSVDGMGVSDLPRVDIVYSYANVGPEIVNFLVKQGVKGIVLAGVGDGNSTDAVIAALAEAAKKGVAVVRCLAHWQRSGRSQRRSERRQAGLHRRRWN